jgi:hypothetical protein
MYRNTRRSSFIAGPALYAGFLTTVIWTPFCQLWNFHGPLETGHRVQEHLVHVLALDDVGRPDAARDDALPVSVRLLEDDRDGLAVATGRALDVLIAGAADGV